MLLAADECEVCSGSIRCLDASILPIAVLDQFLMLVTKKLLLNLHRLSHCCPL